MRAELTRLAAEGLTDVGGDTMKAGEKYRVVDLVQEADGSKPYDNHPVAAVNDHVVRISAMTEPFHWHVHPDSDESFLVLEGKLRIDFEDASVELAPGQILTVFRGIPHRTGPVGSRSVNLTFESASATTIAVDRPQSV